MDARVARGLHNITMRHSHKMDDFLRLFILARPRLHQWLADHIEARLDPGDAYLVN